MKRFLFLSILIILLFAGCDSTNTIPVDPVNTIPFDEPSWVGDYVGEMYNDIDLDHVNGPRGRVDSLTISFFWDGNEGFFAEGTWITMRPEQDDLNNDVHGHITWWDTIDDIEYMSFIANIGEDQTTLGDYKFSCHTNDVNAAPGEIACARIPSSVDSAFPPPVIPPKFQFFYLAPNDQ